MFTSLQGNYRFAGIWGNHEQLTGPVSLSQDTQTLALQVTPHAYFHLSLPMKDISQRNSRLL